MYNEKIEIYSKKVLNGNPGYSQFTDIFEILKN